VENETRHYRKCPCGEGDIALIVREWPNNTFRSTEYSYRIYCSVCNDHWRVSSNWLEQLVPGDPYARDRTEAEKDIEECCRSILDSFETLDLKTEYNALNTRNLCAVGPRIFKKARLSRKPISSLCKKPFAHHSTRIAELAGSNDLALRLSQFIAKKNDIPRFHPVIPKRHRIDDLPLRNV
jgi:hypothetical protein